MSNSMTTEYAVQFINAAISEYCDTLKGTNPALSDALARTANVALEIICDTLNKYNTLTSTETTEDSE